MDGGGGYILFGRETKMNGQIGILNVGAGDTKLTFDKNNPAECIRSGRIVTDMLRRGYALLIEVDDGNGGKTFARVREFRADTNEYIIADFDSSATQEPSHAEAQPIREAAPESEVDAGPAEKPKLKRGPKPRVVDRAIPASSTRGIAVSRSAGG